MRLSVKLQTDNEIFRILGSANERNHAVAVVATVNPLKPRLLKPDYAKLVRSGRYG